MLLFPESLFFLLGTYIVLYTLFYGKQSYFIWEIDNLMFLTDPETFWMKDLFLFVWVKFLGEEEEIVVFV